MAHKKRHHKKSRVGKTGKRRSRVGGFSKTGAMDTAVVGLTAVATSVAVDKITPMLPASTDPNYPLYVNAGKVVIGLLVGSMAEGKAAKYILGAGAGLIFNGGSKLADHYINGTALVAGTVNSALAYGGNTVAGYRRSGRVRGTLNHAVPYSGNTVSGARSARVVAL